MDTRIGVHLVCGGLYHDFDFARLQLLTLLAEHERVRVTVSSDYRDAAHLDDVDCLMTYTCNVRPSEAEQEALHDWVARGGRWFALHGTNSALDMTPDGVAAPRVISVLARTLGSQFIAHPPIAPYRVEVAAPEHPLVAGVDPFETSDELYLSEYHGDNEILLHTFFSGQAKGFTESEWPGTDPHAVMYVHREGSGQVLYLTLGHCRGHYDMRPVTDYYPVVERGSWESEIYWLLLRRGIDWMLEDRSAA